MTDDIPELSFPEDTPPEKSEILRSPEKIEKDEVLRPLEEPVETSIEYPHGKVDHKDRGVREGKTRTSRRRNFSVEETRLKRGKKRFVSPSLRKSLHGHQKEGKVGGKIAGEKIQEAVELEVQSDLNDLERLKRHRREKLGQLTDAEKHEERLELLKIMSPEEVAFAEYKAAGSTNIEAYRLAHNILRKTPHDIINSSKMSTKPAVKALVGMLREEALIITKVDGTEIISKLRKVYEEAFNDRKYDSCLKATQQLGDLIGAFAKNPINIDASKKSLNVFTGNSPTSSPLLLGDSSSTTEDFGLEMPKELMDTVNRFRDILSTNSSID
jgi:hypothetical protein